MQHALTDARVTSLGAHTRDGAPVAVSGAHASQPSFEQVFDGHYERLVRALTVVAGNRDAASDAVQDAFVKAHLRWGKVGSYDDPAGWIRRVAINRLRNDHRSTTRKLRALARLGSQQRTTQEPPEIDEMGRLLSRLPQQQRISTALFYVDGLTVAEIASTLDVSEGTVKSHLHDARRRLRPILENEERHD